MSHVQGDTPLFHRQCLRANPQISDFFSMGIFNSNRKKIIIKIWQKKKKNTKNPKKQQPFFVQIVTHTHSHECPDCFPYPWTDFRVGYKYSVQKPRNQEIFLLFVKWSLIAILKQLALGLARLTEVYTPPLSSLTSTFTEITNVFYCLKYFKTALSEFLSEPGY